MAKRGKGSGNDGQQQELGPGAPSLLRFFDVYEREHLVGARRAPATLASQRSAFNAIRRALASRELVEPLTPGAVFAWYRGRVERGELAESSANKHIEYLGMALRYARNFWPTVAIRDVTRDMPKFREPRRPPRVLAGDAAATLVALAAASLSATAHAGMGLSQVPQANDAPVTVFYPTDAQDQDVRRGPFTLRAAQNAAPGKGNGHLVLISHGSGGNPWTHTDLARALVEDVLTVAAQLRHRTYEAHFRQGLFHGVLGDAQGRGDRQLADVVIDQGVQHLGDLAAQALAVAGRRRLGGARLRGRQGGGRPKDQA